MSNFGFLEVVFSCFVVIRVAVAVFMLIRPPNLMLYGELEPASTDDLAGILIDLHPLVGDDPDGSPELESLACRFLARERNDALLFISSFCTA